MPLTAALVAELREIVGADGLVLSAEGRLVYECDMHTFYKGAPDAVVLPTATEQVQAIVRRAGAARCRSCRAARARASSAAPWRRAGGVMVVVNRMNAILEIDLPNRCATVQPGLINLWLTNAVRERG